MFTLPWPPFRHPLKTLPVSGKVKNPGSFISKSQLTILFDNPYIPIAGLIVDAGGYLPCKALLKKGLSASFNKV